MSLFHVGIPSEFLSVVFESTQLDDGVSLEQISDLTDEALLFFVDARDTPDFASIRRKVASAEELNKTEN